MRQENAYKAVYCVPFIVISLLILTGGSGCNQNRPDVISVSSREVAALSADDVVRVMQLAGLSEEQILEFGTDVRNALALSGTAQVRIKDRIETIFSVHGDQVYIVTRSGGSFIYNLGDKTNSQPHRNKDTTSDP